MDKFTKYPVFMQVFVYLSCATSTAVSRNGEAWDLSEIGKVFN
jgi:hypothetical protein